MANIPYIVTAKDYTFFLEGSPIIVTSQDTRYDEVVAALNSNNMEELVSILRNNKEAYLLSKISEETEYFNDLKFIVVRDAENAVIRTTVQYKGQDLPKVLQEKLISMYKAGAKDLTHLVNFVDNLMANPNEHSKEQLYSFLEHKHMPITEDGTFIAYKAINADNYSVSGNTETHVLQGQVDSKGRILNNPGDTIIIRHDDVENNPSVGCAPGLHVGSYEYALSFKPYDGKIMAVEVNPKHVISVPYDSDCQKCRVSQYKVLNPVTNCFTSLTAEVKEDNDVEESSLYEMQDGMPINRADMDGIDNFAESFIDLLKLTENYSEYDYLKSVLNNAAKYSMLIFNKLTGEYMVSSAHNESDKTYNEVEVRAQTTTVYKAWPLLRYSFAVLAQKAYASKYPAVYTGSNYWKDVWESLESKYEDISDIEGDGDDDGDTEDNNKELVMRDFMARWMETNAPVSETALARVIMYLNFDVTQLQTFTGKSLWVYKSI